MLILTKRKAACSEEAAEGDDAQSVLLQTAASQAGQIRQTLDSFLLFIFLYFLSIIIRFLGNSYTGLHDANIASGQKNE